MQKVEAYKDMMIAKWDMNNHIEEGWKIHTCTMGCYEVMGACYERVIVVYEK